MEILLWRNPQIPPSSLLRLSHLLPNHILIHLFSGSHDNLLVFDGVVPRVEVEIGSEESGYDGYGREDKGC